jgi:farnesyl-diphosphate farnesyltransferase
MAQGSSELLTSLLKEVSRSFYLTMRVLPSAIRPQISLAYLLARTTDTIADTEIISVKRRLEALEKLRERILGTSHTRLDFGELARTQGLPAEKVLLERCEDSLALLTQFSPDDQDKIRNVLKTITSGQELDLKRFSKWRETTDEPVREDTCPAAQNIIALQTESDLDDYTYRVAGCVGEFWTEMCIAHLFRLPELQDLMWSARFKELGIRFGKGLQLVNILRDFPADLQKGRCYLPLEKLKEIGLSSFDLLEPRNEKKLRPVYDHYLDLAESHLAAGWEYTNLIPFTWLSLRLACAWPILIGTRTIEKLRAANVLDPTHRVKVSRTEIYRLIAKSVLFYPFAKKWKSQFPATTSISKCC